MQSYFYRDQTGREIGPLTLDALAKLRFAGVLNDETQVRLADSAEWKPCREIVAAPPGAIKSSQGTTREKAPLSPVLIVVVVYRKPVPANGSSLTNSTTRWQCAAIVPVVSIAQAPAAIACGAVSPNRASYARLVSAGSILMSTRNRAGFPRN
jgi:hypothetical protein